MAVRQRSSGARGGRLLIVTVALAVGTHACGASDLLSPTSSPLPSDRVIDPWVGVIAAPLPAPSPTPSQTPPEVLFPTPPPPGEARATPTPDPIREAPSFRTEEVSHIVRPGESLNAIAEQYAVGTLQLMQANGLFNPNFLAVGQVLVIPPPEPLEAGPSIKLLPDSELVFGPSTSSFDTVSFVKDRDSALGAYREEVDGAERSGGEIVELIAERYSVHPKLLLAVLEYQGGWLTQSRVSDSRAMYSLGHVEPGAEGLFRQLSWAADQLNTGFYRWLAGWKGPFIFVDGRVAPPGPGINAGTAGVQYLFAQLYPADEWREIVGSEGFRRVHQSLFGDPFDWSVEPLIPSGLEQPQLQLPFEETAVWSFTSGPHSAWGTGAAWAALDFAPPGFALGCVSSGAWIVAVGDGPVARTDMGIVVQDLSGDGDEGTGWTVLYLHVESRERVEEGTWLEAGDRIGHPSCEGGVSSGTHLHIARKYNGVWISADGDDPFEMDGWVSMGQGRQYDGLLLRGGEVREACSCRNEANQVQR